MKAMVVVVPGLNPYAVGCCGNEWIETATLDRLASEGVVFDHHYADQPDTAGALRAWRTGCYCLPLPRTAPEVRSPHEIDLIIPLSSHDIQAVLVRSADRHSAHDFRPGWRHVFLPNVPKGQEETALDQLLEAAADALDRLRKRENWLLWLDLPILLPSWKPTDEYRTLYFDKEQEVEEGDEGEADMQPQPWVGALPEAVDASDDFTFRSLQGTYAGMVTYLDSGLDLLLEELKRRELLEDMAVIITSDYGLPLGEHGVVGSTHSRLHEELVHLPLIVRLPRAACGGNRVATLTQPVDLLPTLYDLFELPRPSVDGHSLLPLCRGAEAVRGYACSAMRVGSTVQCALRAPEWAFLMAIAEGGHSVAPTQLFIKPDDRWEVNDVAQHHVELTQHLESVLRAFAEATRGPRPMKMPDLLLRA
jgi:arylsulfatase A-like enzyme